MSIEIRGADILKRSLRENATLDDVKRVVAQNGTELQRSAKRKAPVDTGTLERSILYTRLDQGFTARVSANTDYAGYVEFGTRYMYGRRYMRRAFNQQQKQFKKDMKRLVKR